MRTFLARTLPMGAIFSLSIKCTILKNYFNQIKQKPRFIPFIVASSFFLIHRALIFLGEILPTRFKL